MTGADGFWPRYSERVARIHTLSHLSGRPLSYDYLHSCDVRALPALLAILEARLYRRPRSWWFLPRR